MTDLSFLSLREYRVQFFDALADFGKFLQDFVDGKAREAVQLQFEDGVDLDVAEPGRFAGGDGAGDAVFLRVELHALQGLLGIAHQHADRFVGEKLKQVLAGVGTAR